MAVGVFWAVRVSQQEALAAAIHFFVDDGVHGAEPWVLDPEATAQSIGLRCARGGAASRLTAKDPVLGSSSTISAQDGPLGSLGFLLAGVLDDGPLAALGCTLYVDHQVAWIPLDVPDCTGSFAIPNTPSLAGVSIVMQTWYFLSSGAPLPSSRNAAYLTLGM